MVTARNYFIPSTAKCSLELLKRRPALLLMIEDTRVPNLEINFKLNVWLKRNLKAKINVYLGSGTLSNSKNSL